VLHADGKTEDCENMELSETQMESVGSSFGSLTDLEISSPRFAGNGLFCITQNGLGCLPCQERRQRP
jgi:hypothetical protein